MGIHSYQSEVDAGYRQGPSRDVNHQQQLHPDFAKRILGMDEQKKTEPPLWNFFQAAAKIDSYLKKYSSVTESGESWPMSFVFNDDCHSIPLKLFGEVDGRKWTASLGMVLPQPHGLFIIHYEVIAN